MMEVTQRMVPDVNLDAYDVFIRTLEKRGRPARGLRERHGGRGRKSCTRAGQAQVA